MPTMDQVAWSNVNVSTGGEQKPFTRGELLPEAATPEEAAERNILRIGGAIRTVEVVYTAEELAEQARQRGTATASREAALDVDAALPMGEQVAGREPGLPTMVEPSGSPVVIGDEDLRAEHEQMAADAAGRREEAAKAPAFTAPKAAWVAHAVDVHGMDPDEAQGMTRDQLRERFRPGLATSPPVAAQTAGAAQAADAQAGPSQSDPAAQPAQPAGGAPAADAGEGTWRDYAIAQGADPRQAGAMSQAELMAAYGPPAG